jgi:Tfp pilus assembly protein FimT
MRRTGGFTAFEVAVTLAIIAIMATFVMPPFLGWLQGHRLRGAATNLVADIEMVKIRAIRENAVVAMLFEETSYTVFIDDGDGPPAGVAGDGVRNGTEALVLNRRLPPNVRLALAEFTLPNPRVRFSSRGVPLPADLAGTTILPLVNASGRKQITLNRLGNATSD